MSELEAALKERGFDLLAEYIEHCKSAPVDVKANMLTELLRLTFKAQSEGQNLQVRPSKPVISKKKDNGS